MPTRNEAIEEVWHEFIASATEGMEDGRLARYRTTIELALESRRPEFEVFCHKCLDGLSSPAEIEEITNRFIRYLVAEIRDRHGAVL